MNNINNNANKSTKSTIDALRLRLGGVGKWLSSDSWYRSFLRASLTTMAGIVLVVIGLGVRAFVTGDEGAVGVVPLIAGILIIAGVISKPEKFKRSSQSNR